MRLSHICPTKFISEFGSQSDFILALSHLIDSDEVNEYEKQIKMTGLQIILDNGLFENHVPEEADSLIGKAMSIGATHFFAPDKLYDTKGTAEELEKACVRLARYRDRYFARVPRIAAVVQADNPADYLNQLEEFNNHPEIDLIGLSILSVPKSFEALTGESNITSNRIELLKIMKELSDTKGIKWKNCHLLGLGDSYADVIYAKENCPWVVSNDTSCCFQSGLFEKKLNENLEVPGGKVKEKVEFDLKDISKEQSTFIQDNIDQVKLILK